MSPDGKFSRVPAPTDPHLHNRDERLEATKIVARKLAHDFNNFLAPQLGFVSMAQEALPQGHEAQEHLGWIEKNARQVEKKLDDILMAMAPGRHYFQSEFDLADILNSILQNEELSKQRINIISRLFAAKILGDQSHWRGAFERIINNAQLAMPQGGELLVEMKTAPLSAIEREHLGVTEFPLVEVVIKDSGVGMSELTVGKAFEPFFSARTPAKGAGLGLTFAHGVVRLHGGQIVVESAPGQGTTVTVWVPTFPPKREGVL